MAELVTIEQARMQLKVDPGPLDSLIRQYLEAATRMVELETGRTVEPGTAEFGDKDRPVAAQAVMMLVRAWYDRPDGIAPNTAASELPFAVSFLLWPLKRLTV
ncbi:head-tail connector protein [Sphingomonas yunnanensis]|uniref:head-tail connector protein n=1 Tax=Sphingomonas yunnanensis TaxID=310400 RepID=UPI001CA6E140|nr:head-tail connector protein [Sphingomonas yunnanensis]MBY9062305.1 head-tail connector protein [Sphingomonas yunnanensis]